MQEFSSAWVTVWLPWRLWLAQWNRDVYKRQIQDYGQVETFDNEHTVYERIKIGTADATLGTSNNGGRTGLSLIHI